MATPTHKDAAGFKKIFRREMNPGRVEFRLTTRYLRIKEYNLPSLWFVLLYYDTLTSE